MQNIRFVDIDFPELIAKKCDVISNTPQLRDILGSLQRPGEDSGIFLRSEHYLALGCDLTDLARLEGILAGEVDASSSLILCTAEVSITYMNVEAADALIRWATRYDESVSTHNALCYYCLALTVSYKYTSVSLNNICRPVLNILLQRK